MVKLFLTIQPNNIPIKLLNGQIQTMSQVMASLLQVEKTGLFFQKVIVIASDGSRGIYEKGKEEIVEL